MVRECRDELGLSGPPSDEDIELAWSMHGGIYYFGVRTEIYAQTPLAGLDFVIESSVDGLIAALQKR